MTPAQVRRVLEIDAAIKKIGRAIDQTDFYDLPVELTARHQAESIEWLKQEKKRLAKELADM